jgi:hypothetical protein
MMYIPCNMICCLLQIQKFAHNICMYVCVCVCVLKLNDALHYKPEGGGFES